MLRATLGRSRLAGYGLTNLSIACTVIWPLSMSVKIYVNSMDEGARRLHGLLGGNPVVFDEEFFKLRENGFIAVIGSNEKHHFTYQLFRKVGCPDIYVHLDCHDDILLIALPNRIGDLSHASFVGHLIRDGVTVAFYGTNYWSHQVLLFGRSITCYLRNNLFVYDPFRVHFLDFSRYLVVSMDMCKAVGVEGVKSYIDDCINSGRIEEIYVNEGLGVRHNRIKLYRYGKDITIPAFNKLLLVDRDLSPGLIIKWRRSEMTDFKHLTAYLSIDLDVLCEDCQVDELNPLEIDPQKLEDLCRVIREMARNMKIVAADICGFYIPDRMEKSDLLQCTINLSPLLETLEDAILRR